jgi:hypothetical protein
MLDGLIEVSGANGNDIIFENDFRINFKSLDEIKK